MNIKQITGECLVFMQTRAIPTRAFLQVFSRGVVGGARGAGSRRGGARGLICRSKRGGTLFILSFHLSHSLLSLPLVFSSLFFCLCGLENIQPPPLPHRAFFLLGVLANP